MSFLTFGDKRFDTLKSDVLSEHEYENEIIDEEIDEITNFSNNNFNNDIDTHYKTLKHALGAIDTNNDKNNENVELYEDIETFSD